DRRPGKRHQEGGQDLRGGGRRGGVLRRPDGRLGGGRRELLRGPDGGDERLGHGAPGEQGVGAAYPGRTRCSLQRSSSVSGTSMRRGSPTTPNSSTSSTRPSMTSSAAPARRPPPR